MGKDPLVKRIYKSLFHLHHSLSGRCRMACDRIEKFVFVSIYVYQKKRNETAVDNSIDTDASCLFHDIDNRAQIISALTIKLRK